MKNYFANGIHSVQELFKIYESSNYFFFFLPSCTFAVLFLVFSFATTL